MDEVSYSPEELLLVNDYASRDEGSRHADDWSKPEYAGLVKTIKQHYIKAQNYSCYSCRQRFVESHGLAWTVEHIIPRSSRPDFMFVPRNLCVICPTCNVRKKAKDVRVRELKSFPEKSEHYKIAHPHFDVYAEHVRVVIVACLYQYFTEKGKATIEAYDLLRFQSDSGRSHLPPQGSPVRALVDSALSGIGDMDVCKLRVLAYLATEFPDVVGGFESAVNIAGLANSKADSLSAPGD